MNYYPFYVAISILFKQAVLNQQDQIQLSQTPRKLYGFVYYILVESWKISLISQKNMVAKKFCVQKLVCSKARKIVGQKEF